MNLFLLGAGGFAREVAYVLNSTWTYFNGYLSDDEEQWGKNYPFGEVVGSIDTIDYLDVGFIPAVGSPRLKKFFVMRAEEKGWKPHPFIQHKQSFIGDAEIGDGTIICSMCSITTNVKIGKFVNVNLNCTIGHDVVMDDYVNLSPHCTISGDVHIEKYCDLGSGADILPGVTIGTGSVIGAGCVVTKDVPSFSVVVGVPGKVVGNIADEVRKIFEERKINENRS
jgi:sugar O-acyltransferase (sialic acid O-acetyltransferase NeuD family)